MIDRDKKKPPLPSMPLGSAGRFIAGYFWFILKNIAGWTMILSSLVIGPLIPGPGGIPLFLLGFALISFPGKRRLTSRVLRGRPISLRSRRTRIAVIAVAVILPAGLYVLDRYLPAPKRIPPLNPVSLAGAYLLAVVAVGLLAILFLLGLNLLLKIIPRGRRRVRPWLRHRGIRLLPPRYRLWFHPDGRCERHSVREEIVEIHERHHERIRAMWRRIRLR